MSQESTQSDLISLSGKTALVTGAAKRIGRAVVHRLVREGLRVVVHYRDSAAEAQALVSDIAAQGGTAWALAADFETPDTAESLFEQAVALAGPIDFLINSASIFPEGTLREMTSDDVTTNMNVNAMAPFLLGRAFASRNRAGAIINFLDTMIMDYDKRHVPYHLSKQALYSLTRMMAVEYAPHVRVNAVAPGLVLPPPGRDEDYLRELAHTNPLQRYGSTDGIAEAVVFLLRSGFITGQVIFIDGGRHLRGSMYG
jgi:NAD(P)-dependent dehydrogenase (short-subunit alcohol dehydrogenase family)